jgi:hypothetical protein
MTTDSARTTAIQPNVEQRIAAVRPALCDHSGHCSDEEKQIPGQTSPDLSDIITRAGNAAPF